MFSTSCKYGIRAVLYLAVHSNEDTKLGVEKLSEELSIPKHFLAKILQQLSKNRLVSSSKGRNGGFYLSVQNKQSNLYAIVESIDGVDRLTNCILGLDKCSATHPCPYHETVHRFRTNFNSQMLNETIEQTANRIDNYFEL